MHCKSGCCNDRIEYRIAEKCCRRKFCDFAREQAFCSINFVICVLIFRSCVLSFAFLNRGVIVTMSVSSGARFTAENCVRSYHLYKDIWDATVGEELECVRESDNPTNGPVARNSEMLR